MTTKTEIQDLLRFLTQDAKIPLQVAMPKIKDLQKADLTSTAQIAKSTMPIICGIFVNEKTSKKVLDSAKRVLKKRPSTDHSSSPSVKRIRSLPTDEPLTPAAMEEALILPSIETDEEEMTKTVLHTNRAPLVLAFAVVLLKYTMPQQPLSSRLSLAQAVVSANSRTKAVSIGLEKGPTAEDEGWGLGQPKVRIMGREVRALKRWGYDPEENAGVKEGENPPSQESARSDVTLKEEDSGHLDKEPALWGLDLEALRSDTSVAPGGNLPTYTPQSARAYLLKSFASPPSISGNSKEAKKKSAAVVAAEKEGNLALLLSALDLLYVSWVRVLSSEELDRRSWAWYVHVRPEVESGVAGWGGKGEVRLSEILGLRRKG